MVGMQVWLSGKDLYAEGVLGLQRRCRGESPVAVACHHRCRSWRGGMTRSV